MLRHQVRAPLRGTPPCLLVLDALPLVCSWLLLTGVIARPFLAAVMVACMAYGLCRGDGAKRAASGEPLVFTDGLLGSIFFYPSLYAEFVTPLVLAGVVVSTLLAFVVIGSFEQPLWANYWWALAAGGIAGLGWRLRPGSEAFTAYLRRHGVAEPSGLPVKDAAGFGPLASIAVHAATAHLQRPHLRRHRTPGHSDTLQNTPPPAGPIVMLQLESFFDARRVTPLVPTDHLPNYDRCVAGSILSGRMQTPAYGANTVRTEFAALTGMTEQMLGLDHFNPYAAFARVPIDSIAWRLRTMGYRTICVHPFARTFYGRNLVLPNLGFDEFIDITGFVGHASNQTYVSDLMVVDEVQRLLRLHGPRVFVFVITMGNHSPWTRPATMLAGAFPQSAAFGSFLAGLSETDCALGQMAEVLRNDWKDGLLVAFGDHQPSLPALYRAFGHTDRRTDYLIWRSEHAFGRHRDISTHELPSLMLQAPASALIKVPQVIGLNSLG